MVDRIFVSYRRDDDPAAAARVRDGLAATFGKSNVFMDVDNLLAGQRFDEQLAKALVHCDVLIAIIGSHWMEILQQRSGSGERDYVREEIAGALQRKIVVIPARVGREGQLAQLPRREDLPEDIRDLVLYQKHDLTHERFGRDIAELIEAITIVRRTKRPLPAGQRVPWGWVGASVMATIAAGYVAAYYAGVPVPPSGSAPAETRDTDATAQAKAEAERQRIEAEAKRRAEEEAARRAPALAVAPVSGRSFRDRLANGQPCSFCPEMVVIPSGEFVMGSPASESGRTPVEGPQHSVSFNKPFAGGRFAVTRAEFATFVGEAGHQTLDGCWAPTGAEWKEWKIDQQRSWRSPGFEQDDRHPVVCVRWDDAKAFTVWLSRKTGKSYRLLSEAEREYAARGGTITPFWWGTFISPGQASYRGDRTGSALRTLPVDSFDPNPWGLYNVHGNVAEWVEDCWNDNYQGAPSDGSAWTIGRENCTWRVLRGGAWTARDPNRLRAAARDSRTPINRDIWLGFRVARAL